MNTESRRGKKIRERDSCEAKCPLFPLWLLIKGLSWRCSDEIGRAEVCPWLELPSVLWWARPIVTLLQGNMGDFDRNVFILVRNNQCVLSRSHRYYYYNMLICQNNCVWGKGEISELSPHMKYLGVFGFHISPSLHIVKYMIHALIFYSLFYNIQPDLMFYLTSMRQKMFIISFGTAASGKLLI